MKTTCILNSILVVLVLSIASCRSSHSKNGTVITSGKRSGASSTSVYSTTNSLPPGQAKKLNGDQSAKSYAPGQQKKKYKKTKG